MSKTDGLQPSLVVVVVEVEVVVDSVVVEVEVVDVVVVVSPYMYYARVRTNFIN